MMEMTKLEMVRGDTLQFGIEVEFDEAPQELESVFFSCKKNYDDDANVFQKKLSDGISYVKTEGNKLYYVVRVAPEDTESIEAGQYYYDLQISLNSDVFTILNGVLRIYDDVTIGVK